MVKDHSDSERGNLLPPHGLLFPISSKGSFIYASSHRQDYTYQRPLLHLSWSTGWNETSSMGPPHEGSIRRPIAPWANALTTELHLAPDSSMGPPWRIDPTTHERTLLPRWMSFEGEEGNLASFTTNLQTILTAGGLSLWRGEIFHSAVHLFYRNANAFYLLSADDGARNRGAPVRFYSREHMSGQEEMTALFCIHAHLSYLTELRVDCSSLSLKRPRCAVIVAVPVPLNDKWLHTIILSCSGLQGLCIWCVIMLVVSSISIDFVNFFQNIVSNLRYFRHKNYHKQL